MYRYFVEGSTILYLQIYNSKNLIMKKNDNNNSNNDIPCATSTMQDDGSVQQEYEEVTMWYVNEGVHGCFKDAVLSDVLFQPQIVDVSPSNAECSSDSIAPTNRHILVGCEGAVTSILHPNLPFVPHIGMWIRYTYFGAYTASLASTGYSSAIVNKGYIWANNDC